MGISTFYTYHDNAMVKDSTPEGDHTGNVEVTLAEDTKNDNFEIKYDKKNDLNRPKPIRNSIIQAEEASRILKCLELIHSEGVNKFSIYHDIEEKSSIEKCCDAHLSSKELDVLLEGEFGTGTLSSSGKYKESSKQRPSRKVTFHTDIVTRVVFILPVSMEEKKIFFYTANDIQQFRMEYMWELQDMDGYDHLAATGSEVWNVMQDFGETVLRFLFP